MQQDGFFLQEIPLAAIGEIQGDMLTYIVGTDGSRFSAKLSEVVDKMQEDAGCLCVQTAKLDIPSAEVLTLNTTPKAFNFTVPVGFYANIISASVSIAFNSVAYATNTNLQITGGATATGILAASSNVLNFPFPVTQVNSNVNAGSGFTVNVQTGDPTAGDSDITVYITYVLVPL